MRTLFGRAAAALLGLGAAVFLAPREAAADWPIEHVFTATITPNPAEPGEGLTLTLGGDFPYDCGEIVDTNVVAAHVAFTMRPRTGACSDTTRSWSSAFPIGAFSPGVHTITVERRLIGPSGSSETLTGTFQFGVGVPPPKPPPPACPLFSHFALDPDPATDDTPTRVTLHGCYPWPCGEIVGAHIVGATRVSLTIARRDCPDSASAWSHTFDLGLLPAGEHNLLVEIREEATPWVAQLFGQMFTVHGDAPPPPPPPPPPSGPLFTVAYPVPTSPTTAEPTLLRAHGIFPYDCGFLSDVTIVSPSEIRMTARRGLECAGDTARVWTRDLPLGFLPAGPHVVQLFLRDAGSGDSAAVQEFTAAFDVADAGAPPPPPPPPPPVDSLTATHPNPFSDETRFSVLVDEPARIEVAVFDLRGRAVRRIFRGEVAAGAWSYVWDGRRDDGTRSGPGIYFYRVTSAGRVLSRRVVLLAGP